MASAFAQRIARSKARRQGGSQPAVGGSAFADRIARSKARREGRGEEEEEERGLLSRVWYGEDKDFGDYKGGRTGIEDLPGQFADVALSPIEKGLKPLID